MFLFFAAPITDENVYEIIRYVEDRGIDLRQFEKSMLQVVKDGVFGFVVLQYDARRQRTTVTLLDEDSFFDIWEFNTEFNLLDVFQPVHKITREEGAERNLVGL